MLTYLIIPVTLIRANYQSISHSRYLIKSSSTNVSASLYFCISIKALSMCSLYACSAICIAVNPSCRPLSAHAFVSGSFPCATRVLIMCLSLKSKHPRTVMGSVKKRTHKSIHCRALWCWSSYWMHLYVCGYVFCHKGSNSLFLLNSVFRNCGSAGDQ